MITILLWTSVLFGFSNISLMLTLPTLIIDLVLLALLDMLIHGKWKQ